MKVKKQNDILEHLIKIYTDKNNKIQIGINSEKWFNTYNGSGLAKKWFDLIK